jgi:DNA-binding NarL/FixJ family response regulator
MKLKQPIQVILADDHAMIRRAISRILEKDSNICIIGEASTGTDALRLVQELKPDVLVLDLEMPDVPGIQVARELRANHVPVFILILSACDDHYFMEQVLRVGVDGYVHKSEPASKLRELIHQLFEKRTVAFAFTLTVFLPKLAWAFQQAI